jgi:hypothetical protein
MENNNQQKIKTLIEEPGGLDLLIYNSGYGDPTDELKSEIENTIAKQMAVLLACQLLKHLFSLVKSGQFI